MVGRTFWFATVPCEEFEIKSSCGSVDRGFCGLQRGTYVVRDRAGLSPAILWERSVVQSSCAGHRGNTQRH